MSSPSILHESAREHLLDIRAAHPVSARKIHPLICCDITLWLVSQLKCLQYGTQATLLSKVVQLGLAPSKRRQKRDLQSGHFIIIPVRSLLALYEGLLLRIL